MPLASADQTALAANVIALRWVFFLDIDGDPLRAHTGVGPRTFSSTGDADLDGFTFDDYAHELISVSDIQHSEDGSETLSVSLSGLVVGNADLLAAIGDTTKWRGRKAKVWWYLENDSGGIVGNVYLRYLGYMSSVAIEGDPRQQMVRLSIEGHIASIAGTAGRTYGQQSLYDSGDVSANATLAAANGSNVIGGGGAGGGGAGSAREIGSGRYSRAV